MPAAPGPAAGEAVFFILSYLILSLSRHCLFALAAALPDAPLCHLGHAQPPCAM
jgi:hypothetical protein